MGNQQDPDLMKDLDDKQAEKLQQAISDADVKSVD